MFGEDDIVRGHKSRADAIMIIIIICFGIIFSRLFYLQVYKGKQFKKYSLQNRLRQEIIRSPRGMIFSRNNQILVHNAPRFDVILTPQYFKNKKDVLKRLAEVLEIPLSKIKKTLKKNRSHARYRPIIIKKNVSRKVVAIIETENERLPGISISSFVSREYNDREIGGHLLGYISEISQTQLPKYKKRDRYPYRLGDYIGQSGLEEEFDLDLRGQNGHQFMEVDALGRMKRLLNSNDLFGIIEDKEIESGKNVRLTIDRDLQLKAYESFGEKVGSAVVVDIKTGEILSMVSTPSFDPTQFSKGLTTSYWNSLLDNENKPLIDRAVKARYSPASVFKIISSVAALEMGLVNENTSVVCTGSFKIGNAVKHCWKKNGHGRMNLVDSLRESCDSYYYKMAMDMDIDDLAKYARSFGLGKKSGISLKGEVSGLIPTKEWKKKRFGRKWQKGETLSCIIGQSYVSSTPLQLAMMMGAIANNGTLYRPLLVKEIFTNSGEVTYRAKPEIQSQIEMKPETLRLVKKGLFEVSNNRKGTAWKYRDENIKIAGKTGTSQVINFSAEEIFQRCDKRPYKKRHHGLFVAYAPAENPQIAVSVIVEHGCSSGAAVPIARDIIHTYMKKYFPNNKKITFNKLK